MQQATETPQEPTTTERGPLGSSEAPCYTVLDLFSGIGGFSLGLTRAGFRTTAFCEIEEYPRSILRKHWPDVPIFEDVRKLHATDLPEPVDVICGGYPCQPFSLAGQRKGKDDDRHLWPEIVRLIRELDATTGKPTWCIFENVAGHVSMGLDQVLLDLEAEGYDCAPPFIIPACAINAPHRRDRVWVVAHASSDTRDARRSEAERQQWPARVADGGNDVANTDTKHGDISGLRAGKIPQQQETGLRRNIATNSEGGAMRDVCQNLRKVGAEIYPFVYTGCLDRGDDWSGREFDETDFARITNAEWITLPGVRARNDGLPNRVARLKALGNAVVPQIPELIGRCIRAV